MMSRTNYVRDALLHGASVRDSAFDLVYPLELQRVSHQFWTPVDVANTASRWLGELGCTCTLDVGAGVAKFCIIASVLLNRRVTGLEQRDGLVNVARAAAAAYEADVDMVHGTLESLDPSGFDSFYFFNPFAENLFDETDRLDGSVEHSEQRCFRDLAITERWLEDARVGTTFITYHGLGGRIPATFDLMRSIRKGSDHLRLWTKRQPGRADGFLLELDEGVLSSSSLARVVDEMVGHPEARDRVRALLERPLG